jgi:hypothetical protein
MFRHHSSLPAALLLALPLASACSQGDSTVTTAHAEGESARASMRVPPNVPVPGITPNATPYTARPVTDGGTVGGTVEFDGAAPQDSMVTPPEDVQRECGTSLPVRTAAVSGTHVAGAVVWLEGVRSGKDFAPVRRFEVTIGGCQLVPRTQAVPEGATLHVHSTDRLRTLLRLVRWPGGETAATVATNDAGEVVPDDRVLSKVGLLEVKGVQPSWMRAWVLVFDHPYAATTSAVGAFSLDSVPAGQYKLVAWHERLGRVEQSVTVTAGQTTSVTLKLQVPNASPTAPRDTTQYRRGSER